MSIGYGLSVAGIVMSLAMNTATAGYTVTHTDCATEDFNQQVKRYGEQMAAADKMHNQDLYAQARDAQKEAQMNADACAALQNQTTPKP